VHKENLARSLKSNPLLVERMSRVLVERKTGLAVHEEQAAKKGADERVDPVQSLGDRIRKFFGLA
jgi:hypothetical protein